MPRIIDPQWRDEQSDSNYPFVDTATRTDQSKSLLLSASIFLDASLYPVSGDVGLYLSSIIVANRAVTIWIGTIATARLASATFDPLAPPEQLAFLDSNGRAAGILVCDPVELSAAQTWSLGTHIFSINATTFVAACVIPLPAQGLRGLLVGNALFTGDVWIVGDGGVVVRADGGDLRIDVVGDPLYARRLCLPAGLFATPRFVRTINGIAPDENGNFQFNVGDHGAPDTILRIVPIPPDALQIELVGQTISG